MEFKVGDKVRMQNYEPGAFAKVVRIDAGGFVIEGWSGAQLSLPSDFQNRFEIYRDPTLWEWIKHFIRSRLESLVVRSWRISRWK
jgi:hypothetical protein